MKNLKRCFLMLFVAAFFVFMPTVIHAETNEIDWSKPIRVKLVEQKNNNLFIVQYGDEKFEVSMFGIDVLKSYTTTRHRQENGETVEYEAVVEEKSIFTDLLYNNTLILELDSESNKYNKDGVIQAWFWANGELFQGRLISEGRAKIDEEICEYSSCDKYYGLLTVEQEFAERQLLGLWGQTKIQYVENVGGAKSGMQFNLDKNFIAYIMIGAVALLFIVLLIVIISGKKKKKKQKKLAAQNTTMQTQTTNDKKENVIEEITEEKNIKEKADEKVSEPKDNLDKLIEETREKVKEEIVQSKNKEEKTEEITESPVEQVPEVNIEEAKKVTEELTKELEDEEHEVYDDEKRASDERDRLETEKFLDEFLAGVEADLDKTVDPDTFINQNREDERLEENVEDKTEESAADLIEEIANEEITKDILLRTVTTMFDSKDARSKETQEIINIEYIVIDNKLNSVYENLFVKPMRNMELSSICLEKTKITQDKVNGGLLLEEAISRFMNDAKDCKNIYVWGNASIVSLLGDAESKLTSEDFAALKDIETKVINYKNDFATRQGIEACGLSKAVETFGLEKSDSQVKMMENLYKAERQ